MSVDASQTRPMIFPLLDQKNSIYIAYSIKCYKYIMLKVFLLTRLVGGGHGIIWIQHSVILVQSDAEAQN